MDSILVPLDGSERSEYALPYARFLSALLPAELRLLHVVTEGERHDFVVRREQLHEIYLPYHSVEANSTSSLRRHAEAYLNSKLPALRGQGLLAHTEVVFGAPAEAIAMAAERAGTAMIVMATHGRGNIGRWLIGSVAHSVLRQAAVPVLAIRGPAAHWPTLRRIIVPLDGSVQARAALPLAIDLARRSHATLVLLMVLATRTGLAVNGVLADRHAQRNTLREQMFYELGQLTADCPDVQITSALGEGFVGETIGHEAARHEADLIVMTAHGDSGPRRLSLGSVTDKVLRCSPAPVLVIPNLPAEALTAEEAHDAAGAGAV
jgi:nucleotide-binding universal stress UspA family protein